MLAWFFSLLPVLRGRALVPRPNFNQEAVPRSKYPWGALTLIPAPSCLLHGLRLKGGISATTVIASQ